uniref:Uncharacterized protein n=1 Tax=Anguilla anguilla TaxID=7936 RepID=A0A0E9TQA7_ANGAN
MQYTNRTPERALPIRMPSRLRLCAV